MSKTIFIGGRLESKEKGNVVAGANAILDDTKGKKQNVINKETDDELLRLEQSKQDNLTFDNVPTEDSTNPVTSGGVYTAEKALSDAIEAILLLIPSAATALNKLVDTNTMNSSISTATATFRGTYNAVTDLGLTYQATHAQIEAALDALGLTADNNDYAFVQVPVSDQSQDIAKTERYKNNGTNWQYEYDLNTSGFTSQQWAAINSGITVALVTKLTDLPTAAALQLALNAKQDTLTFDTEPTALSQNPVTSGGIFTAIKAVATALSNYSTTTDNRLNILEGLIPSEAASNNKLTDKAYVDGLIQAITELIPAEATTSNQLADKAYVLASILAATPAFKGQFTTLAELQAVTSPKDGDLGIVRTKDSDGMDVFTVYQYLNNAWGVFYSLSYHPQTKPATTGTTGDYPYNGMGRVELAKNMVNTGTELAPVYENQLTQDMFYKGAVGSRVPNTNTIFVIRYDYVLGEDITVPANCVLEFDGGSISGNGIYTMTNVAFSNNSIYHCVFKNVLFITPKHQYVKLSWFENSTVSSTVQEACKFGIVDGEGLTYDLETEVEITNNINLKNCNFLCKKRWGASPDYHNLYIHSSDYTEEQTYSGTINAGATTIPIGADKKYTHVLISSDDVYAKAPEENRNSKRGEFLEIKSMTGGETVLFSPTLLAYSTNIKYRFVNIIEASVDNCTFKGEIVGNDPSTDPYWGYLLASYYVNLNVTNCEFEGLSECLGHGDGRLYVRDSYFHDSYPYGILIANGSNDSIVTNCVFKRFRHGVCCGGEHHIAKNMIIENNNFSECTAAIDNHPAAYGSLIEGNYITDSYGAINISSPNATIIGNTVCDGRTSQLYNFNINALGFINVTVKDNVLKNCDNVGGIVIKALNNVECCIPLKNIVVSGNAIYNCNSSGVEVYLDLEGNTGITGEADVIVSSNDIKLPKYNGIAVAGAKNATITDNNLIECNNKQPGIYVSHGNTGTYNGKSLYLKNNFILGFGGNYSESVTNHPIQISNIETVVSIGNRIFGSKDNTKPVYNATSVNSENEYERGTTAERPTDGRVGGYSHSEYYDTTLKKLIYWQGNGSGQYSGGEWHDAAGNLVQ